MERVSSAEWAKRVERWVDSGLSAKEFAAETGLKASMLSYWKWKLRADARHRDAGAAAQSPRAKRADVESVTPRGGPPVQLVELHRTMLAEPASPVLALVLKSGITVQVPVGFDESTLTRLLQVVEASR